MTGSERPRPVRPFDSAFTGYRFPPEVLVLAVRWYLRYGLSYRDVEELLAERGVEVDRVTMYRWVQTFTALLVDAARFARHSSGDHWFVDETYVKVAGVWRYVHRAVHQDGQVIDVLVSIRRDADAARRFFRTAMDTLKVTPTEVVADRSPVYPRVLDEVISAAWHHIEQYANNRIEADHAQTATWDPTVTEHWIAGPLPSTGGVCCTFRCATGPADAITWLPRERLSARLCTCQIIGHPRGEKSPRKGV